MEQLLGGLSFNFGSLVLEGKVYIGLGISVILVLCFIFIPFEMLRIWKQKDKGKGLSNVIKCGVLIAILFLVSNFFAITLFSPTYFSFDAEAAKKFEILLISMP